LCIANRSLTKARPLAEYFSRSGPVTCCRFDAVPKKQKYELIINATSAGLRGEVPPFPDSAVAENTVCYDLAYGLKPTPFSTWGRERGAAQSVLGWGMLVEQAAESFRIWRGVRPDTAPVLSELPVSA
jgi:shikimate dehydrogenase